jgi:hypothetical protein
MSFFSKKIILPFSTTKAPKTLSAKLTAHLNKVGAKIPKPDPRFDPAKKAQQIKNLHTATKAKLEK